MTQVTTGQAATHDVTEVSLVPHVGGMEQVMDGDAVSFTANQWSWIEWTLTENLHLTGALVSRMDWQVGDYGFAAIANPAGMKDVTVQANAGQADVDLGVAGYAGAYDPAVNNNKPVLMELWSASGGNRVDLIERRWVSSVSGSVVTLAENLTQTHAVGVIVIPVYSIYSVPRGDELLEGGIFMIGSGDSVLGSPDQKEATEEIPAGLCVCLRVKASGVTATRGLAVTFEMRRP